MKMKSSDSFRNLGSIPYQQYRRECGRYDLVNALAYLQAESIAMGNHAIKRIQIGDGEALVTPETIGFMAKNLLLNARMNSGLLFGKSDFEKLVLYFNHLETDLNYADPTDPTSRYWLIRAMYSQGRYQRIPNHILGRYYLLLKKIPGNDSDISRMIYGALGLGASEAMLIGASIASDLYTVGYVDRKRLEDYAVPKLEGILTKEKISKFLQSTSITIGGFRSESAKWEIKYDLLKRYEFNPLALFPVIDTTLLIPQKRYLVPSIGDLVYRFTEGIYYSVMDFYRGSGDQNRFSTTFGYCFEKYCGYLLQEVNQGAANVGKIISESSYKIGKDTWKTADWLLASPDVVVQLECKKLTTSNNYKAVVPDDTNKGFDVLLDRLAEHVIKLYIKSQHIAYGRLPLISDGSTVHSLIVTLDDLYMLDSRFKDRVSELAAKREPDFPITSAIIYSVVRNLKYCANS